MEFPRTLLLLPLLLSSCAVVTSSGRWAPVELERPDGMELSVSDRTGRFAGFSTVLSGAGKVATVPLAEDGLHLFVPDRSPNFWALGLLVPFLPTFGLGPDEEDTRVEVVLRLAYAGEAEWGAERPATVLDVDPRAVRLLAGGSEPALRPVAWSSSGHHGDVGVPLPEAGARLSVSAGDPLILFFDVTHEALEARGECVLEVEVEQGDGEPRALRLRLRPERVWHFLLLG